MITTQSLAAILRGECKPPENGVVGLVDELLENCRLGPCRLTWISNQVTWESLLTGELEMMEVTLRKSVLRAVIARLVAMASQGLADPVNPYGGRGRIADELHPETAFQISFINTQDDQRLEVTPVDNPTTSA
jgi:hypothetical protein